MKIVVIIPAYNAETTLESVFERIPKGAFKRIKRFIIVNDGSKDKTKLIVKKLMKRYPITLINHTNNRGYGGAQKTAYDEAKRIGADITVMLHADGQYAPELLLSMIEPIEKGKCDVVGGSRILGGEALSGGMPIMRYIGNRFLTWLENLVFRMRITEFHSGYKAYSRHALELIPYRKYSNTFYFDSEMLIGAKRNYLKIVEIPIPTRHAGEKSYLNPIKYGLGVLKVIFRYLKGEI